MKIREHPLIHWPITWTRIDGDGEANLTGEIGIFKSASISRVEPLTTCYLLMDFQAGSYLGRLVFEDSAACRRAVDLLQKCEGRSIQQIGDLESSSSTSGCL